MFLLLSYFITYYRVLIIKNNAFPLKQPIFNTDGSVKDLCDVKICIINFSSILKINDTITTI